jgi:hypothetical protein
MVRHMMGQRRRGLAKAQCCSGMGRDPAGRGRRPSSGGAPEANRLGRIAVSAAAGARSAGAGGPADRRIRLASC